jgi:DNA-binding beta-propeller fold protein YncE
VAPSKTVAAVKPESLVQIKTPSLGDDVSDIDDSSVTINGVLVSSNAPLAGDPDVVILDTDLTTVQRDFTVGESLESVSVNQLGDVYLTADDGANTDGRIVVVNRLGTERDGDMFSLSRDRIVSGAATTLVSPKGFDVADEAGLLLVTDNADPAVKVFGAQSGGNAPPLFSTTLTVAPWDLAYDPDQDRLYVALTDARWRYLTTT